MKLVKMSLGLALSQPGVERGFNISKLFVADGSLYLFKSKMVFADIKRHGGAHKVSITSVRRCLILSKWQAMKLQLKRKEHKEK